MFRTQIYLTEDEKSALQNISFETGKKQSELIRHAVDQLIENFSNTHRLAFLRKAKGIWKNRKDIPVFKEIRESWDRSE